VSFREPETVAPVPLRTSRSEGAARRGSFTAQSVLVAPCGAGLPLRRVSLCCTGTRVPRPDLLLRATAEGGACPTLLRRRA
jgi:hypothetical protein